MTTEGGESIRQSPPWWPWSHPNLRGEPSQVVAIPRGQAVFVSRPSLRPLVVLLDQHLCQFTGTDRTVAFLLELLAVSPVQTHLYADSGPPPNLQHVQRVAAPDWAQLRDRTDGKFEISWFSEGETQIRLRAPDSLISLSVGWTRREKSGTAGDTLSESDARALLVAQAVQVDLFITDRRDVLSAAPNPWMRATAMSPATALPVVGLYLRRQGLFVRRNRPRIGESRPHPESSTEDASVFYWQAALSLLPYHSSWSHICADHDSQHGTENTFALLAKGLPVRLGQVLRCRDRLLSLLARPPDIAVMDEALTELDQLLVWLVSIFDITARVANAVLGIGMSEYRVGWQRDEWLRKVKKVSPSLHASAIARKFKDVPALVFGVSRLRNMVHGPGLATDGTIPVVGEYAFELFGALPKADARNIVEALGRVEDGTDWGIREPLSGYGLYVHPGVFVERILPKALSLLNDLMKLSVPPDRAATGQMALSTVGLITPGDAQRLWQMGSEPVCPVSDF